MPTYCYTCESGHPYEEVRAMSEEQQRTVCPKPDCAKPLKRVFETAPIMFKGRGFYSTGG
jgi:putative FmdB family regulatory protein